MENNSSSNGGFISPVGIVAEAAAGITQMLREQGASKGETPDRCGHLPRESGYSPCTRNWGHTGPCAHEPLNVTMPAIESPENCDCRSKLPGFHFRTCPHFREEMGLEIIPAIEAEERCPMCSWHRVMATRSGVSCEKCGYPIDKRAETGESDAESENGGLVAEKGVEAGNCPESVAGRRQLEPGEIVQVGDLYRDGDGNLSLVPRLAVGSRAGSSGYEFYRPVKYDEPASGSMRQLAQLEVIRQGDLANSPSKHEMSPVPVHWIGQRAKDVHLRVFRPATEPGEIVEAEPYPEPVERTSIEVSEVIRFAESDFRALPKWVQQRYESGGMIFPAGCVQFRNPDDFLDWKTALPGQTLGICDNGEIFVLQAGEKPPLGKAPDYITEPRPTKFPNLENLFRYHPPKQGQPQRYEAIRAKALELAKLIDEACPYGPPETMFALNSLRECVMWANASIACNE